MQTQATDHPSDIPSDASTASPLTPSIAGDAVGDTPFDADAALLPFVEPLKALGKNFGPMMPAKRKRGRPPKNNGGVKRQGGVKVKEEEEVCFICFDGGDLVVCDRRSCPKVYHPVCVKRDASFFQTRGRWDCGWHICSMCAKASSYMCYTCTYSLCKVCIRKANFSCIRENDGFCEACLRLVMLMESDGHGNDGKIVVDFDDKNNWEYLFKLYWLAVKKKLTITVEELNNTRNLSKGYGFAKHCVNDSNEQLSKSSVLSDKQVASSGRSLCHHVDVSAGEPEKHTSELASGEVLDKSVDRHADSKSLNRKFDGEPKSLPEDSRWASQILLEFVSHMKHGDMSALTLFDVHELLLDYVERNNLCDPQNKNQINCDKMLLKLFGKACLECLEMLNLIEQHLLAKVALKADDSHGGIADPGSAQKDAEENCDIVACHGKKRKNQSVDDDVAINVGNINLIYLRQNLTEDLLNDKHVFREKVVGSFVRMRIPGTCQNQNMHRLVQVVGTQTVTEKYDVGKKTIDVALEVLNLGRTEVLSIDAISNEDFTEEECKHLQQSMECGLIKQLKVGVIQDKANSFQAGRVSDCLESEKFRLSHFHDRASEAGCTDEFRPDEEKLQLLSKQEEHICMLNEVPEIHLDHISFKAIDDKISNQCEMTVVVSKYEETNSVSALKSEETKFESQKLPASVQNDNSENSKPDPPCSGDTPEQNKTQKLELSFSVPDQVGISKLEDEVDTRSTAWPLLSPAPVSKPPDMDIVLGTMAGNNQSGPFLCSDSLVTSKVPHDSFVLVIPVSYSDEDTLSKCLEEALQTIEEDRGSDVTNEELQGKHIKGDMNEGWGAPLSGNINFDWELPSPVAYVSDGWGAFYQGNALSPVHLNADVGLEAFTPIHPNVDLGLLSPVQLNSTACWEVSYQGNIDLNVEGRASVPVNTSPIWGPSPGSDAVQGFSCGDFNG